MAKIDEMTLMAFADGELSLEEADVVAAALENDPELQVELEKHMRLKDEITSAFASITAEPIPEDILAVLKNNCDSSENADDAVKSNVIPFSAFKRPAIAWPLLAAAAVGLFAFSGVIQQQGARGPHDTLPVNIASALNMVLTSTPNDTRAGAIQVLNSFRRTDGTVCRTFIFKGAGNNAADNVQKEALACSQNTGEWSTVAVANAIPANAYLPAGEDSAPSIQDLTDKMEPLEDFITDQE